MQSISRITRRNGLSKAPPPELVSDYTPEIMRRPGVDGSTAAGMVPVLDFEDELLSVGPKIGFNGACTVSWMPSRSAPLFTVL